MKNQVLIVLFFAMTLSIVPGEASANPSIAGVSGALDDGQRVIVKGARFGIKNDPAPLRFETWGIGNTGKTAQQASGGWWSDGVATIAPTVTSRNRRVGSRDVLDASIYPSGSLTSEESIPRTFYKNQAGFDRTGKMLLNFWIYTDLSNSPLNDNIDTQLKFLHVSSDVLPTWPWGYVNFTMPYRSMSFWENKLPDNSNSTMASYEPAALGATGLRNDENSAKNIFKNEGWYNVQIELDEGDYGVRGGSERISISGPGYSKYGTWSTTGNSAYIDYPEWQPNVANGWIVWYNGKRYAAKTLGINSAIPPDQDTARWHETYPSDKLNSIVFWLWSQKRASNSWNFSNQTLIAEGSAMYAGSYYAIMQSGATDFTTKGASSNIPGTVFKNTQFTRLGSGDQVRPVDEYRTGSKVDHNGEAYQAIADVVSLTPPSQDAEHWKKMFPYPWPSSTIKMFFDSIYVDNSFARVEIGDAATYANSTHREIQPAASWSDGEITIDVNRGSFSGGQAYLFVVDESGNASPGYPITFASAGDAVAPAAPTGLSVQ